MDIMSWHNINQLQCICQWPGW